MWIDVCLRQMRVIYVSDRCCPVWLTAPRTAQHRSVTTHRRTAPNRTVGFPIFESHSKPYSRRRSRTEPQSGRIDDTILCFFKKIFRGSLWFDFSCRFCAVNCTAPYRTFCSLLITAPRRRAGAAPHHTIYDVVKPQRTAHRRLSASEKRSTANRENEKPNPTAPYDC